jgi:hypothetical protein
VIAGNAVTEMTLDGIYVGSNADRDSTELTAMGTTVSAESGCALWIKGEGGGHTWFDNVLVGGPKWGAVQIFDTAGFASGSNVLAGELFLDETPASLTDWQAMGLEQGSVEAVPEEIFVPGDERLAPGSPALGLGKEELDGTWMLDVDLTGAGRPCDGLDAGAYEVCETDPAPPPEGGGGGGRSGVPDVVRQLTGGQCGHAPAPAGWGAAAIAVLAAAGRRRARRARPPYAPRPRSG